MGKRQTKQYTEAFKHSSAKLAVESDQPIAATARSLGINEVTLYGWVKKYFPNHQANQASNRGGQATNEPTQAELLAELKRVKKENARLKLEHEILKKAAAYFASEQL